LRPLDRQQLARLRRLQRAFDTLSKLKKVTRKNNDADAKLTEISTGQRAAYALSLFLAQNSQLTSAPPVMLIDDPIAHLDDLNALSFLD
jgi:recombinational DNA repair ATPase RecF